MFIISRQSSLPDDKKDRHSAFIFCNNDYSFIKVNNSSAAI